MKTRPITTGSMRWMLRSICLLLAFAAGVSPAQTVQTIHELSTSDGADILAGLVQAGDGNFYGAATIGGAHNLGSIFRITSSGEFTVIYSFAGGSDGVNPSSSLVVGSDGNLYGTTQFGGDPTLCTNTGGCGTVFRVTPSGTLTTLYNFAGGNDGAHPQSGLIQSASGAFYGVTAYGGDANGDGTLYEITSAGAYTLLHTFAGGSEGAQPASTLIQASDGNFYGSAQNGGLNHLGTLFRITPTGGFGVLHTFSGTDGAVPTDWLFQATGSILYGTTSRGGNLSKCSSVGCGTVFKLALTGEFASLASFSNGADGSHPSGGLFQASDGNLYDTTTGDGNCDDDGAVGCGTVFRINASDAIETVYSSSSNIDRVASNGALVQGSDGSFYGTTTGAPVAGQGNASATIYALALTPALAPPVQLSFSRSLVSPNTSVTLNWRVLNANAKTFRQCYAAIQGSPSGAGTWSGQQAGVLSQNVYAGSTTILPTEDGTYTYALTCGGIESGFATLTVGTPPPLAIATSSLPGGMIGSPYYATLAATGDMGPKTGQ